MVQKIWIIRHLKEIIMDKINLNLIIHIMNQNIPKKLLKQKLKILIKTHIEEEQGV